MHQELFKNRKYSSAQKWNLQFELVFCFRVWDLELYYILQCINTKLEMLAHRNRSKQRLRLCRSISEQVITHVVLGRQLHSTNQIQHQGPLSSKTHTHVEEILSSFSSIFPFRSINTGHSSIPHYDWARIMASCSVCSWHKGWDLVWN